MTLPVATIARLILQNRQRPFINLRIFRKQEELQSQQEKNV